MSVNDAARERAVQAEFERVDALYAAFRSKKRFSDEELREWCSGAEPDRPVTHTPHWGVSSGAPLCCDGYMVRVRLLGGSPEACPVWLYECGRGSKCAAADRILRALSPPLSEKP